MQSSHQNQLRQLLALLSCVPGALSSLAARAEADVPDRATESLIRQSSTVVERVRWPLQGLIVTSGKDGTGSWSEPSSGRTFTFRLDVFVAGTVELDRRFRVYAPDASLAPFASKTCRLLALLWGIADRRAGRLATHLRAGVVDVWLCRDGEAGGEQSLTSLLLYDILAERTGIEWVRTITHEFGHYLLPGATGYADPEPWSNGLLGERLFTKWLRDALRSADLQATDVPFASPIEIDDYCARQVDPLITRVARSGPDGATVAGSSRKSMDELCALLLFADAVHGARSIFDLLVYMETGPKQPRGREFLSAYQRMIEDAATLEYRIPTANRASVYLPKGSWKIEPSDAAAALETVATCTIRPDREGGLMLTATSAGWKTMAHRAPVGTVLRLKRQ